MSLLEWIPGLYPNAPRRNALVVLLYLLLVLLVVSVLSVFVGQLLY